MTPAPYSGRDAYSHGGADSTPETYPAHNTQRDVIAEGFGDLTPSEFVAMFCREMGCNPGTDVTRIEFRYL